MPDDVPLRVLARAELEIDGVLRPLCRDGRSPRVRPELRRDAIGYGRRALEIAITAAVTEREQAPPRDEWDPRWKLIRDRAGRAATAVELALRALVPDKKRPKGYGRPGHVV